MKRGHRVDDYFAGAMGDKERLAFEAHLQSCAACQHDLATLKRLDRLLSQALPQTLPSKVPRPEWLAEVRASLLCKEKKARPWRPVFAFSALAAVAVLVIFAAWLRPWTEKLTPEQRLVQAYENTMARSFTGTVEVRGPEGLLLSGTFEHAPGDRWRIRYQEPSGAVVEELQVGDQVWRKWADETWRPVVPGPMIWLRPDDSGVGRVPDLLQGIGMLEEVEGLDKDRYAGRDKLYARRASGVQFASGGWNTPWVVSHPPRAEVTVSHQGTVSNMRLTFDVPEGANALMADLLIEQYPGTIRIAPPLP